MSEEQRRYPRVVPSRHEPVEVQVMGGTFLEVVTALDISVGGVCICVGHGFSQREMSERVQLILTLPGKKPFLVRGTICHLTAEDRGGRFGVEFKELDQGQRAVIEHYVEQMLTRGRRT